jgi:hypothetical protein
VTAKFTRRGFVAAAGAGCLLAAPGIRMALASESKALRWASLQPGFTVLPVQYILANKLGQKNGLSLPDPAPYTAVSTYYNDFVAGNYDVCIGSWDTFRIDQVLAWTFFLVILNLALQAAVNGLEKLALRWRAEATVR